MKLRVFRIFVTCYLTCILCRNATAESIAKVSWSSNNTFQSDVRMFGIDSARIKRSTEIETRSTGIILKNDLIQPKTLQESPFAKNQTTEAKNLNSLKEAKCSRYCVQRLKTSKDVENVNLVLLFNDRNKGDNLPLLENNPNLKILKYLPVNYKNLTVLDYCTMYLNLHCDHINVEKNLIAENNEFHINAKFNRQNTKILKNYPSNIIPVFTKKITHKTNLNGYTETHFQTEANVTGIVINILGNLTRAVLIIPTNRMVEMPGIVMSLTSTHNTKGVAVGARSLWGRWCLKLTGVENSNYNFDVIAYYGKNKKDNTKINMIDPTFTSEINKKETVHEIVSKKRIRRNKASSVTDKTINKLESMKHETRKNIINNSTDLFKREFVFKRSADNFSDTSFYSRKSATAIDKNIINFFIHNNSLMSYGAFRILPNTSNIFKEEKIQARSSEVTSLNENNVDVKLESSVSDFIPMQIAESDQSQRLSTQINEEPFEKRKVLLELNPNSKLIAAPGTRHRVIFDATNNCVLPVRYAIQARSSPFRIINIQPIYMWLYPGQTDQVAVDILIPSASQDTVNTLTVNIVGTEISEKTVQVFVQNTLNKKVDNVKPTIEYWFNNNCAGKLDKDRCDKTVWSVDITVQDYDSGLKSVVAIPNRIYPVTKYISGTKDRVTFYYWSTCCTTTATITAIDIAENQYTRTIDVNVWDNLSQGEIAAIVLGVLLLLFLLILLVIAIVYCVRKRNSHDLPYTQRYGSRQPARSERTSF